MTAKRIIKKVLVNVIMAATMILVGFTIATALYSAGVKISVPKITFEYEINNYDLQLNSTADSGSQATGEGAVASK